MDCGLREFGERSVAYGLDLLAIGHREFHGGANAGREFENRGFERGGVLDPYVDGPLLARGLGSALVRSLASICPACCRART